MKKKRSFKRISAICASAVLALTLGFGMGFSDIANVDRTAEDSADNVFTETVEGGGTDSSVSNFASGTENLIYDSTAKLYTFKDGETYWYIDYTEGVKLGNKTVDTDIVAVTVSASSTKGAKDNPYVINSKEDWDNFVTYVGTAANQTKSYVLNADLDYKQSDGSNGTIKSVSMFQGNFYGNGHRISNAQYSTSYAYGGKALGLFSFTTGTAYISDLVIENLKIASSGACSNVGGLVGHTCGNLTVTDVVITGTMTGTSPTASSVCGRYTYVNYGGLLGSGDQAGKTLNLYKCATDVKITLTGCSPTYTSVGGMVGTYDGLAAAMTAFNMYDCYSAVVISHQGSTKLWSGMIGFLRTVVNNYLVRCFSVCHVTTNYSTAESGIMFTLGERTANYYLDNCYGYGSLKVSNTTNRRMPFIGLYSEGGTVKQFTNCKTFSENASSAYCTQASMNKNATVVGSLSELKTAAKGALNNPSIWASDEFDNVTSTTRPNIVDTPILVNRIRVAYYDYKDGAEKPCSFVENAEELREVKFEQSLAAPKDSQIPQGRVFKGWTTDKTGGSDPFTEVPKTLHGDNKLYAVWGVDTDSVTVGIDVTAKNGSRPLEYGEKGFECVYNESGITLSAANLSVSGTDKSDFESYGWQWSKGEDKIASGVSETYRVKNVNESGEYKVAVQYRSASEPLFMGTVTSALKKTTMTKAPLKIASFKFEDGRPYSGAPFGTAVPTAIVTDESGNTIIEGTTEWFIGKGNFNSNDGNVTEEGGKKYETKEIWFELDEKYSGNYGDPDNADGTAVNGQKFEIKFEIEYLHFIFEIEDYRVKPKVYVNLEYGQNYTYNNIAALFEEAFKDDIANFPGLSPVFVDGTDRYTINEYRKRSGTAYKSVKTDFSLQVTFEEERYRVTYDPRNGEDPFEEEEQIGYGIRLSKPNNPEYGNQLFLGWFYDVEVEGQPTPSVKQWNFDTDRVTGETNLYARWLAADTLADLEVEIVTGAVFKAGEALNPSLLKVTATYTGMDGETKLEQSAVLSSDQYEIDYGDSFDGKLHVKRNSNDEIEKTEVVIRYTFKLAGKPDQPKSVTLLLDLERIALDTELLRPYFKDTTVEVKAGVPQTIKIPDGKVRDLFAPYLLDSGVTYTYASSLDGSPIEDPDTIIEQGDYLIRANFRTQSADYYAPSITATLHIVGEKIALTVEWDAVEFSYNGKEQRPTPTFMNPKYDNEIVPANYTVEDTHSHTGDDEDKCLHAVKVGSYSIKIVLTDSGYKFENGADFMIVPFKIDKALVPVPTQKEKLEYRGGKYDLNALEAAEYETYFNGLAPALMTVKEGAEGTNVGAYKAFIELNDSSCAAWDGVSSARVTMDWEIKKVQLSVYWGNDSAFEYNGEIQYPTVVRFIGLVGDDVNAVDLEKDISYNFKGVKPEVGGYTVSMSFKSTAQWAKNYELDDSKSFSFAIVPEGAGGDIILVNVEWGTTRFVYNGDFQNPVFKLITKEGKEDVTDELQDYIVFEGTESARWAGDYSLTISIDPDSEYALTHFLIGKPTCEYKIVKNSAGEGENPEPNPTPNPDGDGNNPNPNTVGELPLWQLIVGGVSAVLFLICASKSFGEYGKLKAAKKEAKELAQMSYAVTYGFAPLPLLAVSFLGAGETTWTIVACVLAGLFVLSLAAMMILSKKRKAAELVVRREKARIEEEKEYARQEEQLRREEQQREEQQRRDQELKMMLAAMQQGFQQQPQFNYDDMQNMIASAMTAMLPAAMQQMQALPPAQSDPNAYVAPAPAAPVYNAPQPAYNASSSEMEELRAQMAAQQEMINRLMNQQAASAAPAAPAYEAYDEVAAAQDVAFWMDDSDEIVSLEELYGRLSDDAKRCYYEIGSYIMGKPQTNQNDGKYAVLFKYCGKTLFKLCIKDDAPVLYYATDSGVKECVRITDAGTLDAARKIVDMRIMKVNGQM